MRGRMCTWASKHLQGLPHDPEKMDFRYTSAGGARRYNSWATTCAGTCLSLTRIKCPLLKQTLN